MITKYNKERSLYTNLTTMTGDAKLAKELIGGGKRFMTTAASCGGDCIHAYDLFPIEDGTILLRLVVDATGCKLVNRLIVGWSDKSRCDITSALEVGGSLEKEFFDVQIFTKDNSIPAIYVLQALEALSNYTGGNFKAVQW